MKRVYHLLVTSYKLRVKLPRFCFAKSPLQNLKGINFSGVARNAPTSYLKPLTSYLFLLSAFLLFCLLPFVAMAQCPDFTDLQNSPTVRAYYGYQDLNFGKNALNYTEPNSWSQNPSQYDSPVPRFVAPFLYEGVVPNRHKVMEWPPANDPIIGAKLQTLPPDATPTTKAIKLGNDQIYYECEAIVYEFVPEIANPILLLDFAVVFEDPEHSFVQQPRFILRVTDPSGNLLESCTEYDVTSQANIPGFQTWQPKGGYWGEEQYHDDGSAVHWRDWTKMSVDLSKYVGQLVQVQIINYDCWQGAHFGYCYFTAQCVPNKLKLKVPCTPNEFTLIAPAYFDSYLWSNGDTSRMATFGIDTVLDSQITCKVISALGCECTLYAYITHDPNITQHITDYDAVICEGETYTLNNFDLPPQDPGTHYYQLAIIDPVACEEYVSILELEVIARYTYFKDAICHGNRFNDYYLWDNIPEYPTPGVWRATRFTGTHPTAGCQLYDVLELVVNVSMAALTIQGDPSPCTGELATYSFLGSEALTFYHWEVPNNAEVISGILKPQLTLYFTDAVSGEIILHGENGCGQGTTSLYITPRQSYDIQLNDQICQGSVYSDYGFNLGVQNEVGFFVHSKHLQSIQGCDSTVTFGLNVLPVHSVRIEPIDTATCNQGDEVTLWALIDNEDYPGVDECDDDPYPYLFAFHYNCGYSYSWSTGETTGGISVNPATTTPYTVTVVSDIGCKVTASQTVVVNTGNVVINDTICFGETYSAYGITESETGIYDYGSITTYDCVVPVTVNLTVLPEAKFEITESICSGERYFDPDNGFDFTLYGEGSYIDTIHFISHKGCDSLVIFNFTIKPQKETFINDNICQFETYNKNGFDTVQNFAGLQILTKVFTTSEGCDSLVVIRLNVYPNPVNVVDFGVVLGLAGTTTTFTNWSIYYDEGMIAAWEWYLGDESSPFATTKDASYIFTEEGDYTVTLKVKGINGCWAQITKDITIDWCPTPTIIVDEPEIEVCGLETVTITGSFEDADILKIKTLNSNGRKARLTVSGNDFTITYSPTIANIGKIVEIVLTAIDSTLPCAVATETIFITVKPKPKIRTKGVCVE